MKSYRCLYNLDMSVIPLVLSEKRQNFEEKLSTEHIKLFAKEALGTGVDAFFCSPTLLRQPLWRSKELPHWEREAELINPPEDRSQWTASERTYFPMREYILAGGNPVDNIFEEVKKQNTDFFFSFRMNDWHFVEFEDFVHYPTLDTFYISHPEYRIGSLNAGNPIGWDIKNKNQQNYLIKEVREHYFNLLCELAEGYDIEGIELDFMRSPNYFPLEQLEEGRAVLTDFVCKVRRMLDSIGEKRNKKLALCVRLPHRYSYCERLGFDVKTWVDDGLVQMVNVTSSYIHTEDLEIENYKQNLPGALIYGEEQMVMNNRINKYGWPAERRTPKEILETTANSFLKRGADGVSFFNFFCTREIEQPNRDPESVYSEPPLEVLSHVVDSEYLEKCSKHYFSYGYNDLNFGGKLPSKKTAEVNMHIYDNTEYFESAALRVICKESVEASKAEVSFNGVHIRILDNKEELFKEDVREGQFLKSQTFNCIVPIELVKTDNTVNINVFSDDIEIFGIELALYKK